MCFFGGESEFILVCVLRIDVFVVFYSNRWYIVFVVKVNLR